MSMKNAAVSAAVLRVLEERVKQARQKANAEVLANGDAGDRVTAMHNDQKIGAVSVTAGRTNARVTDDAAFAAWCSEHYPTEVELKPVVRPAFLKSVLDACKQAGEPCMPDGTLGVPGISLAEGDPYVTVRLSAEAADIVAEMVRTGAIALDGTRPELDAS